MKNKIFFCLPSFSSNPNLSNLKLDARVDVVVAEQREKALVELANLHADTRILVVGIEERVDEPLVQRLQNITTVCTMSTGVDHIDVEALERRNVQLIRLPGANATSVAEHIMMFALLHSRDYPGASEAVKNGLERSGLRFCPRDLSRRRIGLIGAGAVGRELIRLLGPFHCEILVHTLHPDLHRDLCADDISFVSKAQVFSDADIVSLCLPLTADTQGYVGHREVSLLRPGVILINTGRRELISPQGERALIENSQLRVGVDQLGLGGSELLLEMGSRIAATPHIAGATYDARRRMEDEMLAKVESVLRTRDTPACTP